MRILIISENRAIASGIEQQLKMKNLDTETVYSGEIGEEYAELGIYDLLILDSDLSEKSAYEIARSLRIKHCRMPIILLVQKCEVEDRIKGMKSGVDYFLLQPYDVSRLFSASAL